MFQPQDSKADDREVDRMYYEAIDADLRIELDEEVPAPPVALSFGTHSYTTRKGTTITEETPIATYGNFSFIQAPPKSYKSFFTSLLVSAFLKDNRWAGKKFSSYKKDKDVYHFDTEQGRWHCQRGFRRVSEMADTLDNYHTYSLRTIGYKQRLGFIEYVLSNAKEDSIGLVVIDGIADLVSDVNDIAECNLCVQKLMEWSAKYKCHIITIIHSNHNSTKPTGHLGSFLEKKAETQISLNREEDSKIVNVSCKRSRNYGFEDFNFFINRFGYPEVIDASTPDIDF